MALCEMKPMALRTGMGSSRTSWPATLTLPPLAVSSVASTRSVVVLPAPLGPKMLRNPPRGTPNERPLSTSRRPKVLRSPSTSISRGAAPSCRSCSSDIAASVRRWRRPPRPVSTARASCSCLWRLGHRETTAPTQRRIEPIHTQRMSGKITMRRAMVVGRAVERLVGHHEEVLERPAQDHGADGRAAHGIHVGVRPQRAERLAVPGHVEGRLGARRVLRAGALLHAPVGERVAVEARRLAGLDLDDGRLLDLVHGGAEQAGDHEHHAHVDDVGGGARAAAGEGAPEAGPEALAGSGRPPRGAQHELDDGAEGEAADEQADEAPDVGLEAQVQPQRDRGEHRHRRQDERLAQLRALGLAPGEQRADGDHGEDDDAQRLGHGVVGARPDRALHEQRHGDRGEGDGDGEQREQQVGDVVEEVAREPALHVVVALERAPAPDDERGAADGGHDQEGREDPDEHRVAAERVHRADEAGARRPGGEDGEEEGRGGEAERPALEQAARLVEREGVEQGGRRQPGDERGVLDRVPGPVAAEAEHDVGPPGAEADAQAEEEPAEHGPLLRALHPELVAAAEQQRADGEGERHREADVADEQRRRVQHHARVEEQRVEAERHGAGFGREERVGAAVEDHERGEHGGDDAEHRDGAAGEPLEPVEVDHGDHDDRRSRGTAARAGTSPTARPRSRRCGRRPTARCPSSRPRRRS